MGMQAVKTDQSAKSDDYAPRDRFMIGASECYFEAAKYLTGKLDAAGVKRLLNNPKATVAESRGKSLKVNFITPDDENKFVGFITTGDASLELDASDIEEVKSHFSGNITKAIDVDSLVALF